MPPSRARTASGTDDREARLRAAEARANAAETRGGGGALSRQLLAQKGISPGRVPQTGPADEPLRWD
ncbi:hypothetical protein SeLEV6574_g02075 [Synchytrium endobioticum]|nr:hypothetical protein SeLEV6574_g02098 [Synchytrium endobioticum]TPX48354.1 hypothetical protein SeLEV6574_g02075 [Synchytrium endobioticum]